MYINDKSLDTQQKVLRGIVFFILTSFRSRPADERRSSQGKKAALKQ